MNAGSYRECARLYACCMGKDKVEPWIIFTWQKPWINRSWLALSHVLVVATRLDLQIASATDIRMMAFFSKLLKWVSSESTDKLSVSVNTAFHAMPHLLHCALNGPVHPICQTMTRRNKKESHQVLDTCKKIDRHTHPHTHICAQCPSHPDKHRQR